METASRDRADSIGAAFPANRVEARFAISMSMAKNDIERALRDVLRVAKDDAPDFSYRVRLSTGHLVEALDALAAYSALPEVKKLMAKVPAEARQKLKIARGTRQKVGGKALQSVRDNTFHYPSPKPNYNPTSDEQLEAVLTAMGDMRAVVDVDFEARHVTLSFADEVALALSMGNHAPTRDEIRTQFETTRDGALAFIPWAEALVVTYFEANGISFGTPEPKPDPQKPEAPAE
jgi:hypothetical protein